MIHYLVVVGVPQVVRRIAPTLEPALRATSTLDVPARTEVASSGRWALVVFDAPDRLSDVRVVRDGDRVTLVNGPALAAAGKQRLIGEDIHRWVGGGGVDLAMRRLGGSFNLLTIAENGEARAAVDFSGMSPLYWNQQSDHVVISNRSTAVRDALGADRWDARALSWTIGHGSLFGDSLPASDVRYLVPGHELRVDPGATCAHVERSGQWVWPQADDPGDLPNLTSREWDEVTDDLVDNCRAAGGVTGDLTVHLSGGKDSRLALALLLAAGLRDRLEVVSTGDPRHADSTCAAQVADVAGLDHNPTGPGTDHRRETLARAIAAGERATDGPGRQWDWLKRAIFRYEAIVSPWNGAGLEVRSDAVAVKGHGGELYRGPTRHAKPLAGIEAPTLEQVVDAFVNYQQPMDVLGVLQPEIRTEQADWLRSWVRENSETVRQDALPEKFYVDYWLGHWNGPLAQGRPLQMQINPLLSARVAERCFALCPEAREEERLHFEVMRRAAPELLSVPFVKQRWSETIQAESTVSLPSTSFRPEEPGRHARRFDAPPTLQGVARLKRRWSRRARKVTRLATAGERPDSRGANDTLEDPLLPPESKGRRALRWQWSFLESQGPEILELFDRAERDAGLAEICDVERLRGATGTVLDMERNIEGKTIISAVGVALALLDEGEAVREGRA